jgi:hypothetical protein
MCAKLDTTGLSAEITYTILHDDAVAGREHGRLYRRADGGYWMTDELDWSRPFPRALYVEIRARSDWRIESLDARLSGREQRDASQRADKGFWRATIQTDDAAFERVVPFKPETQVDFISVWLKTLMINRLRLAPAQSRDLDGILVQLPSLEPVPAHLRCECIGPEHITTPAGDWDTLHCVVAGARHIWTDSRGIVVATRQTLDGQPYSHRLAEYHWLG